MKRRPRDIGTAAERAVVKAIRTRGFPHAERRALRGPNDAGDITGTPGVCWSVKGGDAARAASDGQVTLWMRDLYDQTVNAGADVGVLVIQRAGVGEANAHRWWAIVRGYAFADMANGNDPSDATGLWASRRWWPVRMLLGDMCELLRLAGYGTRLDSAPAAETQTPAAGAAGGTP